MMFRIVIALCFVTSAIADTCCSPKQWEGRKVELKNKQFGNKKSIIMFSYDAENNRTSSIRNSTSMKGEEQRFQVIEDYVAMMQYEINLDEETCYSRDLYGNFDEICIEDSDELIDSGLIGVGDNTLSVSTYQQKGYYGSSELTVTDELCVPVSQVKSSSFGQSKSDVTLFVDITAGITNTSIFTPPSYCNNTAIFERVLFGGV